MKALLTVAFVAAGSIAAVAQRDCPSAEEIQHSTKVVYLNADEHSDRPHVDSVVSLINNFYVDQYRHFQDPNAPYIMFMTKDANFSMGLGGQLKLNGWYDWNGAVRGSDFSPHEIPIPKDPTAMRDLSGQAQAKLVFTIIGKHSRIGNYLAYVEAAFKGGGGSASAKLKKAYFRLNDFTLGYATSTFCDPDTEIPTVDGGGANGQASRTNLLFRWFHTFRGHWGVAGGVELPSSAMNVDDKFTAKVADYVPDFVALAQYQWDESHVRLSGLLRFMSYRDLAAAQNRHLAAYGLQLSAYWKIASRWSTFAQLSYGKGYASYINDLSVDPYDLVPEPDANGELYAPSSWSFTLGVKYKIAQTVFACLGVGQARFMLKGTPDGDSYKQGLFGVANVFWNITSRIRTGLEYTIGRRNNYSGAHCTSDRVEAMVQLSF